METQSASKCLLVILVSLMIGFSEAASPEDSFFSISEKKAEDNTINVEIIGRGISDTFPFQSTEDRTIYNDNKQLVIGDKIYTEKKNIVHIITGGKCVQRDYVTGTRAFELRVDRWRCAEIMHRMADAKAALFGDSENNNYDTPQFKTYVKSRNGRTTIKVAGKGVLDQFTFGAEENSAISNNDVLVIGDRIYSEGQASVVIVDDKGTCTERKYTNGKISGTNSLSISKCHKIIINIKNPKIGVLKSPHKILSSKGNNSIVVSVIAKLLSVLPKWLQDAIAYVFGQKGSQ